MNTIPPFYENRKDNMSCALAVYRSIIEYFTGKKLTWVELEQLTGYKKGIAAWTVKALTELAKQGWDIKIIEPFNYKKYSEQGLSYLNDIFPKEVVDWQMKNSNIYEMKTFIPEFLKTVYHEVRQPDASDIDSLLSEDRLVSVVLNSKKLNNQPGFVSHNILIYDSSDESYTFHDPGLPGIASRTEPKAQVVNAMSGAADVTGFKYKKDIK